MKTFKNISLVFLLIIFSMPVSAEKTNAAKTFQELTGLVGDWVGKSESGREHSVNYRLSAGGTVLVETWLLSSGRESMTLYHLDGDSLMATHYCPQGNQPRLVLVSNTEKMHFEFRDGTNLQIPDKSHQDRFWLQIKDKNHFQRNENYIENSAVSNANYVEDPQETFSYSRKVDSEALKN